jgi:trans-2-enoyl-CoA reductase
MLRSCTYRIGKINNKNHMWLTTTRIVCDLEPESRSTTSARSLEKITVKMNTMLHQVKRIPRRCLSTLLGVQYAQHGVPKEVLNLIPLEIPGKLAAGQLKIKMLASPINPSDINMVEGTYGIKTKFPSFGGNEGVGVVKEVAPGVEDLKVGDRVISIQAGLGLWRQELITEAAAVSKVPSDIPMAYAATIGVNPCTAYRMLSDFETLQPGDWIIQNGANSMVGLAVVQMARERGVKTINVIRSDRPDTDTIQKLLTNLGGDVNITDTYLNSHGFREILRDIPPIRLGLNCVGGEGATDMARVLATGATMVTYGGMAKKPLKIPYDILTYKQLKIAGFWMAHWNTVHSQAERAVMIDYIAELIRTDKLTFFFETHDLDDFRHVLKVYSESYNFRKIILDLDYPDRLAEHDAKTAEEYWHFEAPVV